MGTKLCISILILCVSFLPSCDTKQTEKKVLDYQVVEVKNGKGEIEFFYATNSSDTLVFSPFDKNNLKPKDPYLACEIGCNARLRACNANGGVNCNLDDQNCRSSCKALGFKTLYKSGINSVSKTEKVVFEDNNYRVLLKKVENNTIQKPELKEKSVELMLKKPKKPKKPKCGCVKKGDILVCDFSDCPMTL